MNKIICTCMTPSFFTASATAGICKIWIIQRLSIKHLCQFPTSNNDLIILLIIEISV